MVSKKILFISWEGGMGHITRDVAIAAELRRQRPDIELSWLASPMASHVLDEGREALLPESSLSVDYNAVGEKALGEFSVNILKFVLYCGKAWARNVKLFKDVIAKMIIDWCPCFRRDDNIIDLCLSSLIPVRQAQSLP